MTTPEQKLVEALEFYAQHHFDITEDLRGITYFTTKPSYLNDDGFKARQALAEYRTEKAQQATLKSNKEDSSGENSGSESR